MQLGVASSENKERFPLHSQVRDRGTFWYLALSLFTLIAQRHSAPEPTPTARRAQRTRRKDAQVARKEVKT